MPGALDFQRVQRSSGKFDAGSSTGAMFQAFLMYNLVIVGARPHHPPNFLKLNI